MQVANPFWSVEKSMKNFDMNQIMGLSGAVLPLSILLIENDEDRQFLTEMYLQYRPLMYKIAFQFFLKVDGSLEKAAMKADEGDVHAAEVENCMIAFAKTLTYPKSTTGKETVYTHRFEFKASSK